MSSRTTIIEGREAGKGLAMSTIPNTIYEPIAATTYHEACDHAEVQAKATNGLVRGGTYMVRFPNGDVGEVELRVGESGIARPVYR